VLDSFSSNISAAVVVNQQGMPELDFHTNGTGELPPAQPGEHHLRAVYDHCSGLIGNMVMMSMTRTLGYLCGGCLHVLGAWTLVRKPALSQVRLQHVRFSRQQLVSRAAPGERCMACSSDICSVQDACQRHHLLYMADGLPA
jgi:hypothetical protein